METGWTIRPAIAGEAQLILELIRELAEYEQLGGEVTATEAQIAETLLSNKAKAQCLLGFAREKPAAFAVFFYNYSTFQGKNGIYLEDIFVRPQFRGMGLGRRLLERIRAIAQEEGCGRMEWSVLDWNQPAIEFYEKLGARALREWIRFRISIDEKSGPKAA
jgi:GNAT superfamily N-acetyltransferase